jgi:hypothetical protein
VGQAEAVAATRGLRAGPDDSATQDDHHGAAPADDDHGPGDHLDDKPAGHHDLHESQHDHHVDRPYDGAGLDHDHDVGESSGKGPRWDSWAWSAARRLQFEGCDVDSRVGQR